MQSLRVALRLLEAAALSITAAFFIAAVGLFLGRVPLLYSALLGFFAGGAATMRTLGVTLYHRGWRTALAVTCAVIGVLVLNTVDYQLFRNEQRIRQEATDYRATPAEVEARVDDALITETGHRGPLGFALAAIRYGQSVGPVRLTGVPLVLYWLLEATITIGVAARWARGPSPG